MPVEDPQSYPRRESDDLWQALEQFAAGRLTWDDLRVFVTDEWVPPEQPRRKTYWELSRAEVEWDGGSDFVDLFTAARQAGALLTKAQEDELGRLVWDRVRNEGQPCRISQTSVRRP